MKTPDGQDTSTMSETQDTPKIGEKVRFWEEQDRINQELIPRVIKQHELFAAHVQGHEDVQVRMAAMDARISETVEESNKNLSKLEERTAL